jgi:hypothetical protein
MKKTFIFFICFILFIGGKSFAYRECEYINPVDDKVFDLVPEGYSACTLCTDSFSVDIEGYSYSIVCDMKYATYLFDNDDSEDFIKYYMKLEELEKKAEALKHNNTYDNAFNLMEKDFVLCHRENNNIICQNRNNKSMTCSTNYMENIKEFIENN